MDTTAMKIFYSWQSDLPNSGNRNLIQGSIDKVVKKFSDIIKIEADRDTSGKSGSPDITKTIFEKIDESDLFIADITMINKSKCKIFRGKMRAVPNPNVLIELGYAAKTMGWERIVCIYNSDYSPLTELPFDLRQHRVTSYSIKKEGKPEAKEKIVNAIYDTIKELEKTGNLIRVKSGKVHHKIVGYNFAENKIDDKVHLYKPSEVCVIKSEWISECQKLIEEIKKIKFDFSPKEVEIEEKFERGMPPLQLLGKYNLVKIDDETKKRITKQANLLFEIDLDDDFFFMGRLRKKCDLLNRCDYSGEELEIHKHELFTDLRSTLYKIEIFEEYIKTFDKMFFVPLAITNDSTEMDKDINIQIVVEGENIELIFPTRETISENLKGVEGIIYKHNFISELFGLPEDFSIQYDDNREPLPVDTDYEIGFWGESNDYDEVEYEDALKEFVATPISNNSYVFQISSLQPQEAKWLGGVLLLRSENKEVKISYSIRSNNSGGAIIGKLN